MKFLNYFTLPFRIFVCVVLALFLLLMAVTAQAQQRRASFGIMITVVAPPKVQVSKETSSLLATGDRHATVWDSMQTAPLVATETTVFSGPGFSVRVPSTGAETLTPEMQAQTGQIAQ